MADSDVTFTVTVTKFLKECNMKNGRNKLVIRFNFYFEESKTQIFKINTKFSKKQIANKIKRYVRIEPFDREKMKWKMIDLEDGECIKLSIHPGIYFFIFDEKDYENWMFVDEKTLNEQTILKHLL